MRKRKFVTSEGRLWVGSTSGKDSFGDLPRQLSRFVLKLLRENVAFSLTLVVVAATVVAFVVAVVLPGYFSPMSRIYTSRFGYASVLRGSHRPFPVTATCPVRRVLGRTCVGEGLIRSEPTIVPIIPMGVIKQRLINVGDRVVKGQLLAEIDSSKAQIKVDAARAALDSAKAELERVRIGSSYILANERPERDKIRVDLAEREVEIQKKLQEINLRLANKGYPLKQDMLRQDLLLTQSEASLREMKFNLGMSLLGVSQSFVISEAAVRDAQLALDHRLYELDECKVKSTADGLIERCLVNEGEFNQDPGKPGFLIASGSWFEANFDQGAYRRMALGARAEVRLEAAPEHVLQGKVTSINPFVSYDLGGPETPRPVRPMGTGTPEWPATFAVRITVEDTPEVPILPGMTGFASIRTESEVTCLPREAVSAITGGKGMVYIIADEHFRPHEVTLGVLDGDYVEIRAGLRPDDRVIRGGHQVLEPGDLIQVVPALENHSYAPARFPSLARYRNGVRLAGNHFPMDGNSLGTETLAWGSH